MIRETFDKFYDRMKNNGTSGQDDVLELRKMLSLLRQECKKDGRQALLYYLVDKEKEEVLLSALLHPDAKVRKNTALLLGVLGKKEFLPNLFAAYEKEEQLFVRSAYLQAISEYDFREYLEPLKERKELLEQMEFTDENQTSKKHLDEEYHLLSEMLLMTEGGSRHEFRGYHEQSDLLLLTNRNHAQLVQKDLAEKGIENGKVINVGVLLQTDKIHAVLSVRTYAEALFILPFSKQEGVGILSRNMIPGLHADTLYTSSMQKELKYAAQAIWDVGLLSFLEQRHKGKAPFYFRIEWKGSVEPSKKGTLIKRLAAELEQCSGHTLINSTGNYDLELRIIENKKGMFHLLLKLYTIPEERFSYRLNSVSGSIRPVNAALTAALAQPYFSDNARVLDPFCGVGTMLIERYKRKKTNTMYGIDIYGKALEGARENTEQARQIIHYINRDFFEFKHEYLFDEIFTNMPMVTGKQTEHDMERIYRRFFEKALQHLTNQGIIVMYTHNITFARKYAKVNGFYLLDVFEISKKEECFVAVFRKK